MSWSSRRTILLLSMLSTLVGVCVVGHLYAQKIAVPPPIGGPAVPVPPGPAGGPPGTPPKKPAYDLGNLVLPKDDDLTEVIESTSDKIKTKDWEGACQNLQKLLGRQ